MSKKKSQTKVSHNYCCGLNIFVKPGSAAEEKIHRKAGLHFKRISDEARVAGIPPTPHHDLVFRGGKTLQHLNYVNFYVAGATWNPSDIQNIDRALAGAMSDQGLNNVLAQYFGGRVPTTTFARSRLLQGEAPTIISRGDIDHLVQDADASGALTGFDLVTTVLNFLLPPGTVLTDDAAASGGELKKRSDGGKSKAKKDTPGTNRLSEEEQASSLEGLGGYHGSVHLGSKKVYFAVGVFSQEMGNGKENGIVAFDEPWKNVVATFYHELCEARTDADVEEANNTNNESLIGWTSAQGEECGDFPIFEDPSLSHVFKQIMLAGSTEIVPVQFQYSNAVHGPEGPISKPNSTADNTLRRIQPIARHLAAQPVAILAAAGVKPTRSFVHQCVIDLSGEDAQDDTPISSIAGLQADDLGGCLNDRIPLTRHPFRASDIADGDTLTDVTNAADVRRNQPA
jgi:hypothetical protein